LRKVDGSEKCQHIKQLATVQYIRLRYRFQIPVTKKALKDVIEKIRNMRRDSCERCALSAIHQNAQGPEPRFKVHDRADRVVFSNVNGGGVYRQIS
jgi:hypothetical protein